MADEAHDMIAQCVTELTSAKGRLPTFKQLAQATGMSEEECKEFMDEYRKSAKPKARAKAKAKAAEQPDNEGENQRKDASTPPSQPSQPYSVDVQIPPAQPEVEDTLVDGEMVEQAVIQVPDETPEEPDNQLGLPEQVAEAPLVTPGAKRKLFEEDSNGQKSQRFDEA